LNRKPERRAIILAAIFLLSFLVAPWAQAARSPAPLAPRTLVTLIPEIRERFVENVPQIRLVNGAIAGVKQALRQAGVDPSQIKGLPAQTPERQQVKALVDLITNLNRKYPALGGGKLVHAAIRGALKSLNDPYTLFLSPDEYAEMKDHIDTPAFGGLGIYIDLDSDNHNQLVVVEPMEGTPAADKGLQSGDAILKINGQSTRGFTVETARRLLRGPVGSQVTLTIGRADQPPFEVTLTRASIAVRTVQYKVVDKHIGYLRLTVFGETTPAELDRAMEALEREGVDSYIIDLRNNGGGYITTSLDLCSFFLPPGSLVTSVIDRENHHRNYNSGPNSRHLTPLAVLVNGYSASASEITAGAIQDLKTGILIGTKTYGKASVQVMLPLSDGSGIKITTAHYLTPKGRNISKVGLQPDIVVELPSSGSKDQDPQLDRAIQYLDQQLGRSPAGSPSGGAAAQGMAATDQTSRDRKSPGEDSSPPGGNAASIEVIKRGGDEEPASGSPSTPGARPGMVDPQTQPIPVSSLQDEEQYIATQACPADQGTLVMVRRDRVNRGGAFYDLVEARCSTCGAPRSFLFDIGSFFGR